MSDNYEVIIIFKDAAIAGEMMANIIEASEAGSNQDQSPVYFHLRDINRRVSGGAYSRLREVNKSSSF